MYRRTVEGNGTTRRQPGCRIGTGAAALTAALFASTAVIAADVQLSSGERLQGEILDRTAEHLVIDHALFGRLEIPLGDVVDLQVPAYVDPDEDAKQYAPAAFQDPPKPKPEWTGTFDFGGAGSFGNTDTQNFTVAVTAKRKKDDMRTTLASRYFFGSTDGDRTDNRFTAGGRHEWLMPDSPWSVFVDGTYTYDEFQSYQWRVGFHGGVGYELITEEDFDLQLLAGAGANYEDKGPNDGWTPEGLLGFILRWQISERQSFTADTTYYPSFEDFDVYRVLSNAAWSVVLDAESNLSLTAGLQNEYNSDVGPGTKNNDLRIYAGLKFDF